MKVKQLIEELNKLIERDPRNADVDVKWYDSELKLLSYGDGWPIQLFQNSYTKKVYCVLNAMDNPPAFGLVAIANKRLDERTFDEGMNA